MTTHGRLNIFQRLVRQWDALHPYNAAQVIRVQGSPNLAVIRTAWHEAMASLGLGRARVVARTFHFEHLNGQMPSDLVRHITNTTLESFLSHELNRRFDETDFCPFRPFVLETGTSGSHFVGIVYHHWIADGVSIRALLRQWFVLWHDPQRVRREPLKLSRSGYWSLFGPSEGRWRLAGELISSVRWTRRIRRVRRMSADLAGEFAQAVTIRRFEDGIVDCLRDVCRSAKITLHDLLLAAAAEACDQHLPLHRHRQRHDLAMGAIVDLRPTARLDLSDTFGMFLGFTMTLCQPDDLQDWPKLLHAVASQARVHKQQAQPQASFIRMAAGLAVGGLFSRERMIEFYRKRVPLAGGTSNVNLTDTWAAEYHPAALLEYLRVSPTGPIMPLVFSTTTLARQFNLCLTRRNAIVSEATASAILDTIVNRLDRTAQTGDAFGDSCRR
ncbi:MAG TPA: hypothetical protein VGR35_19590 [Tepidisphaeraceae bacterium]|nr:hypothetical protein [Tepidisphaeraceae bacterium]